MKLMRRWFRVMAVVGSMMSFVPLAVADEEMWRAFHGRVVFSDVALAPASVFESPAMMTSALRRIQRSAIDQNAGFWRVHMIAFLDRPAATGSLMVRASDVADPRAPRQVRVFEVPVERGGKELRLDDFVVTAAMGFEPGRTYEFAFEAPPEEGVPGGEAKKAGKADAYAKGVITLR